MEDTALALGAAFDQALGDKAGIRRYGSATVPMDEVLVRAAVDLSGRPYVVHDEPALAPYIGPVYPTSMTRHIWESFGQAARVTLHVDVLRAARPGRPPGRAPRGGGAVQGGLPGAARGRRDRPARRPARSRAPRARSDGRRCCRSLLLALAGVLVGGAWSLLPAGRAARRRAGLPACSPLLAAAGGVLWLLPGEG